MHRAKIVKKIRMCPGFGRKQYAKVRFISTHSQDCPGGRGERQKGRGRVFFFLQPSSCMLNFVIL